MVEVREVRDRTADRWIKVISIIAMTTLPLISTIGYLFIDRQDLIIDGQEKTTTAIKEMSEKLNVFNAQLQTSVSRISRNEADISDNSSRIFVLEGENHGM